ncbi:hypothetical protein NSA45_15790 [Paraclostridium bifermentans]|uniref:hypothetical protein n=1 Tax=Paraclostridium bifermentans TaxID=1490 RepID=UPI00214A28EB|nr:hypothetical protein [Paraclostridium bifermentans]MCR1877327.1 hypothetical protein [Paraclostridium bifermentans]
MERFREVTLSGNKNFTWYIFNNSIFIEKKFKGDLKPRVVKFAKEEIVNIISFILEERIVQLKNDLTKVKFVLDDRSEYFEYCKKGLGTFVYKYSQDKEKAQSTSQLVAILTRCNILVWDGKKRNMKFWLSDSFKEETLNLFEK